MMHESGKVIVVLGGAVDADGRLSPYVQLRLDAAMRHYREGHTPRIILSGKGPRSSANRQHLLPTEAEAMGAYLVAQGVPAEAILKEEESTDTAENIFFTRVRYLDPNGWRRPLIVTSAFHVPRVKVIADWVLGDGYQPEFSGAPNGPMSGEELTRRTQAEDRYLRDLVRNIQSRSERGDVDAIRRGAVRWRSWMTEIWTVDIQGLDDGETAMQKQIEFSEAITRKYPEQVVLVTTRSRDGKANVMAVGWVTIASGEPPMFVLGIDDGAYTFELIRQTEQFVVAFPSEQTASQTLFAGTHSGRDKDKFADAGIAVQEGVAVKAPLIRDAVANFECKLVQVVQPGDCPLVIGQVVAAHVNADANLRRLYTLAKGYALGGVRPMRQ